MFSSAKFNAFGITGVGGKVYYDFAKSLKYPTYLLQCMNHFDAKGLDEMFAAVVDVSSYLLNFNKDLNETKAFESSPTKID